MDERKMYGCMIRYIFCMCFLFCFKRLLVLGNKQVDTTTDKEASDEQKELQQALFLVELLKSEYVRVLRENKEMKTNRGLKEDGAMCATTVSEKGNFERSPITPQVQHWPRRIPPIFPALRKWRRRFPQIDSNVYYDIPTGNNEYIERYDEQNNAGGWRRFQYEDAFGPQPGGSNNTSSTTKTATPSSTKASSAMSLAPTSTPSTENDNITVSSSSPAVSKTTISEITTSVTEKPKSETTKETVTTSLTSSSHTTRRIMLLLSKKTSSKQSNATHSEPSTKPNVSKNVTTSDTDLEVSQAAAEFEKELGSNLGNWKKRRSRKLPKKWRASTRVHLAGSTRYQIPLPENHAFCYTNPDNALCRTFI